MALFGLGRRAGLAALLPSEMLARTTAAAGVVLHPDVTQKLYPFCNSSQSQELRDTETQCATCAKAVMSSAGLRPAIASGATATSLLPQACGQWAVHQPKTTCSPFASPNTLFCVSWDTLACPSVRHSSDSTRTMPITPAHIRLFPPLRPKQLASETLSRCLLDKFTLVKISTFSQ